MESKIVKCPMCGKKLDIDSIRTHRNGRKRTYWECDNCNLSMMHKGEKTLNNAP